jgi:hypothetical protein
MSAIEGNQMKRELTLLAFVGLTLPTNAIAQTVTYVCVEERSVGWEVRDTGEEIVGKFRPSESKLIIKWYPEVWSGIANVRYLQLPRIEVSQSGQTFTYETTDCDSVYKYPLFDAKELTRSQLDNDCERKLRTRTFRQYGNGAIHYRFSKDFRDQPPSMNYVYTATIVFQTNAYLSRGSCARID